MQTCSNEQFADRLRERVKLLDKILFNSSTDDESSSDSESDAEYNYHSEQEFLDEEENSVSVQEAWDNTYYDSNDEGNQQVPYHSQERGRRVVPPPTKARSCRPKKPPPVRPPPRGISSAFAGSRVVHENSPELRFARAQGLTLGTIMQFNPGLKIIPGKS